jgi:DNA repair exonuclease SbcCD ATPase subunit
VTIDVNDGDATSAIFEHVVETFNKSLPDFLKQSVNQEAEKKYLYDTLSADLKQYLTSIAERTQKQCQDSWLADKERLQENVRELEAKAKSVEEQREELTQKQLSADRQRRALSDRVVDLEKQVMTYEAEREQFQLENKSLVNKLKVAGVAEKDIEAMRDEITRLQAELNDARRQNLTQNMEAAVPGTDNSEKIAALQAKVTELEKSLAEANDKEQKANQELEAMKAKVDDAETLSKELSEIESQIEQFEQVKAKKDARINDLTQELAQANETVALLKETVAKYGEDKSDIEKKLNGEIAVLKQQLADTEAQRSVPEEQERSKKRGSKSNGAPVRTYSEPNSHIDDILSDTDWLVSPSSLKSNKNAQTSNSNNTTNHTNNQNHQEKNDAQMTLF